MGLLRRVDYLNTLPYAIKIQDLNQITKMPEPGTVTKFTATYKKDKKLFATYFDFKG